MAEFSRKELKKIFEAAEIEVPKDVLSELCSLHMEVNEELVTSNKNLEKDLKDVTKQRDELKALVPDGKETVSKESYDKLKNDFDTYKTEVENKETYEAKEKAFREFLKNDVKISDKRMDRVVKVSKAEIEALELGKDGKIKGSEKLAQNLSEEWADFIETSDKRGSGAPNPPGGGGAPSGKKTREEIEAITDHAERRAAIAENMELFQ